MKFKYTYKARGFSIGCQPKDFIETKQHEHKFETIFYDRELTEKEIEEYELIDLNKAPKKFKINIEEVLSKEIEIEAETELEALEVALKKYNKEEIILDNTDFKGYPNIKAI